MIHDRKLALALQVSTSYLIQTGDGQNFLFDAGTGSIVNLYATQVSLATINKVR